MTDVVCLGELLVDMFPAEAGLPIAAQQAWYPKPGGAPANVAVAIARLGKSRKPPMGSAFIGKVGDDVFGRHLADVLRTNGVDVRGLRFERRARTTLAFHAKPDPNTAEFLFYRNPGADALLEPGELDGNLLRGTRCLHIGSISLIHEPSAGATREAVRIARHAGALISFDVNYRPALWKNAGEARASMLRMLPDVHLLKVNEAEMQLLARTDEVAAAAEKLLALGPELVVATLGPKGSYFRIAGGGGFVPGFEVQPVDTVGCGDAFVGALLTRLLGGEADWPRQLQEQLLVDHLRFANAAGALTALKPGVIPALPTQGEVDAFLAPREDAGARA